VTSSGFSVQTDRETSQISFANVSVERSCQQPVTKPTVIEKHLRSLVSGYSLAGSSSGFVKNFTHENGETSQKLKWVKPL